MFGMRGKFIFFPVIFALAIFLRVMFLPQNVLTFGYDQARDAYVVKEIIAGDLKILGPPASASGLYHGVLYYYFLVPPYLVSNNPVAAAYWLAFFNALLGVIAVSALAFFMTKKWGAAALAGLFYAVSFEATQYATWLSNPTIAIVTVPIFYLGLWLWITKKYKYMPVVTAIGLGFSVQAEVFLLYHTVPLCLWLWLARKKISKSEVIQFIFVGLLSVSTMILTEIKFGFQGLGGLTSLVNTEGSIRMAKSFGDYLLLFLNQIGRVFAYSTYPGNVGYGAFFVFVLLAISLSSWHKAKDRKAIAWQPFLATWLLSHLSVVSVGGTSTPFLLVGIGPAVAVLLGIILGGMWQYGKKVGVFILVSLIVIANLSMIMRENKNGSTIFAIQTDMLLTRELAAIDYTYTEAQGNFAINTVTSPLWVNTVWSYLYNWYGMDKYGYLPSWRGRDQVGRPGNNLSGEVKSDLSFLILEPSAGIPSKFINDTIASEESLSDLIDERAFGEIVVQKRKLTHE